MQNKSSCEREGDLALLAFLAKQSDISSLLFQAFSPIVRAFSLAKRRLKAWVNEAPSIYIRNNAIKFTTSPRGFVAKRTAHVDRHHHPLQWLVCHAGVLENAGIAARYAAAHRIYHRYMSLQHELIHGHPTRFARLNALFGTLPLAVWYPYGLYRDSHLAHHRHDSLTIPVDDPESYYFTEESWARFSPRTSA